MSKLTLSVHSDLHLEFDDEAGHEFDLDLSGVDVLILAGDIHIGRQAGKYISKWAARVPHVLYVLGNHEYYMNDFDELLPSIRKLEEDIPNLRVLENDYAMIGGVRFLGCSMWTDMQRENMRCMSIAENRMNDYELITRGSNKLRARDTVARHMVSKAWLTEHLNRATFSGKTVVITHHLPTPFVVAEEFKTDRLSAAYASTDLDPLIQKADIWIFGHQHTTTLRTVDRTDQGKTILLSNPRGYYPDKVNNGYAHQQRIELWSTEERHPAEEAHAPRSGDADPALGRDEHV